MISDIEIVLEEMLSKESLNDISRMLGMILGKLLLKDETKWNMNPIGIAYFSQSFPCAAAFKSGMESVILLELVRKLDEEKSLTINESNVNISS